MKLLVFAPHGGVQLLASDKPNAKVLWSSDDDQDFAEEFDDILDPNSPDDLDDLDNYLIEREFLGDNEEYDIDEQYLEDEDEESDDE